MSTIASNPTVRLLDRRRYRELLTAAIAEGEFRFARETALHWLAAFPGDLGVNLVYALALLGEGRAPQALNTLRELCRVDAEFLPAAHALVEAENQAAGRASLEAIALVEALKNPVGFLPIDSDVPQIESNTNNVKPPKWGVSLSQSRQWLESGELERAERCILEALAEDPPSPLAAITHLRILRADQDTSLAARLNLARFYHEKWSDSLQCSLLLAEWLMEAGGNEEAVALLHRAAARDVSAQVPYRLWGPKNPFDRLWPQMPNIPLRSLPPANVAARMGWNHLPVGEIPKLVEDPKNVPVDPVVRTPSLDMVGAKTVVEQVEPETPVFVEDELKKSTEPSAGVDGRFPIYVVLSTRRGLERKYGPIGAVAVEQAIQALVETMSVHAQSRNGGGPPRWGVRAFLADDAATTAQVGMEVTKPDDPWAIKLALADLDTALAKRGERIGALLIVGGDTVVPFHKLPNPVDDSDVCVPSDNPYGTRDQNYFIPEWPVGRLPGDASTDPAPLIQSLFSIATRRAAEIQKTPWLVRTWKSLIERFFPMLLGDRFAYGVTASVWRRAAAEVFRPIGSPRSLLVSPPHGKAEDDPNPLRIKMPPARMGYFNLHGIEDGPAWYGQKDPADTRPDPSFPVALLPQHAPSGEAAPQIVFTEACYGAHVQGRRVDDALSLAFLRGGSRAVVGSTCTTYGSIAPPLAAADLLAQTFWKMAREGIPAGEALRLAKIRLAEEMTNRQGYLDGQDQKTLISFVLYGDPLARPDGEGRLPKGVRRAANRSDELPTVCDRELPDEPAPSEVLTYVRHVVSQYLPGMEDARVHYSSEHAVCRGGHACPTSQLHSKQPPFMEPDRQVVTLEKAYVVDERVHSQYARLTLDAEGKLVKLVVSR